MSTFFFPPLFSFLHNVIRNSLAWPDAIFSEKYQYAVVMLHAMKDLLSICLPN